MAKKSKPKKVEAIKAYYASGKNTANKSRKLATLTTRIPRLINAKKRRLIARLKQFEQTGTMDEPIKVLRKRLKPFLTKVVPNPTDYRAQLIKAIGGEDAYFKARSEAIKHIRRKSTSSN